MGVSEETALSEFPRSALVAGGGRGIGRAIAERLASRGCRVGLLARSAREIEAAAGAIREAGGSAGSWAADVLDRPAFQRAVDRFHQWAGGLDLLVFAAGQISAVGPLGAVDLDGWWRDVETSIRGSAQAIRCALPYLRQSPRASITILVGPGHNSELAFAAGYGCAQAGLVRLVESLGRELEREGVAVFAVYPGLVPTAMIRRLLADPEARRWLPQFTEAFSEGKEVGPEPAAEMVAWLAEHRPPALQGRVVAAPLPPEILETRLERIAAENRGVLRLR